MTDAWRSRDAAEGYEVPSSRPVATTRPSLRFAHETTLTLTDVVPNVLMQSPTFGSKKE